LTRRLTLSVVVLCAASVVVAGAQGRGGRAGGGAPPTARAAAPQDLTGYWVSVVTEYWHLRMLVPPKGEFAMLPLNAEARKVAMAWDPAKEKASNTECSVYGAPSIMRTPGRFYLHWTDDNTLQMDVDSGTQTRVFHFGGGGEGAAGDPSWQGYSAANWEGAGGGRGRAGVVGAAGQLRVVTTRLRPGYLRRNGAPYSENTRLEEFFDSFTEPNGDRYLLATSIVTDPTYLTDRYASTMHFKKIPDRQGWNPTPCRVDEAR
jgi:hypothetical protein